MNNLSNSNLEKLLAEATKGPWEFSVDGIWATSPWNARVKIATVTFFAPMNAINERANGGLIALTPDLAAEVLAQRELFAFVANDPCFKLLGTVTQDRVSAALDHQDHSS